MEMLMPFVGVIQENTLLLCLDPLLCLYIVSLSPVSGFGQYEFKHPAHSEPGEVPGRSGDAPAPTWTR